MVDAGIEHLGGAQDGRGSGGSACGFRPGLPTCS